MSFVHGLELNERFYREAVEPLLRRHFSEIRYSAALLGYGSDVLGFDDATSTDHNWGPRLQLFLSDDDMGSAPEISELFAAGLPTTFAGYPTSYTSKRADGTQSMTDADDGRVNHLVEIHGIESYFESLLETNVDTMATIDWLRIPEQVLLEITAGSVFEDGLKRLNNYREKLSYYPPEVRKMRLAALWDCVANEEAFVGRMVEYGDELGTRIIAARLVGYLVKICFMLRKRYSPYSKWLSVAFRRLGLPEIAGKMDELLRESALSAIEVRTAELSAKVLELQNAAGEYPSVDVEIQDYYNRPYRVIMAQRVVRALVDSIADDSLKNMDLASVALDAKVMGTDFTKTDVLRRLTAT